MKENLLGAFGLRIALGSLLFAMTSMATAGNVWTGGDPSARQEAINDMQKKMAAHPYLDYFANNRGRDLSLSSGVKVANPFLFDDGNGVALLAHVDYKKIAKLLELEGFVPDTNSTARDRVQIFIDFTHYAKTSFGPAYVARFFVPIIVSAGAKDKIKAELPAAFSKLKTGYGQSYLAWKYWEGGGIDAQTGGREVLKWPQDPAIVDIDYSGKVKTVSVAEISGLSILSLKFDSTERLRGQQRFLSNGTIVIATPGNKAFNPSAYEATYTVWPVQGLAYESLFPFDPKLDEFKVFGKLAKELDAVDFDLSDAQWLIRPYYAGALLGTPSVKKVGY